MDALKRELILRKLTDNFLACNFGDGIEKEYALYGFPKHKGFQNMADEELLKEYNSYDWD